ncbi:MAG: hypothetical protein JG766_1901, partial [Desulfacinum sp.]|nr:hypothetical protein [Desulfacinum sp.]
MKLFGLEYQVSIPSREFASDQ